VGGWNGFTVKPAALKRVEEAEARGDYDEIDPDSDNRVSLPSVSDIARRGSRWPWRRRWRSASVSAYGSATVTEQVVDWYVEEDRIAEWTNVGEPEYL